MKKSDIPEEVLNFFRKQGSKGGKTRAKSYSKEQLSEMGKKGGRPKGSGKKRTTKATKKGASQ
jgi:general stress protein YciG